MTEAPRRDATHPAVGTIRLGLIGDNIAASKSPRLHELAGRQNGRKVIYDRLVPRELGLDFQQVLSHSREAGYRGVNVTYPYKETAAGMVRIDDPRVAQLGAVNTVLFDPEGPRGFNTDYSGFIAAYRASRRDTPPGRTLLIGAGGVGKAVAFGLLAVGLTGIVIADRDEGKAMALREALRVAKPGLDVGFGTDAQRLAGGCAGLINCTPVGMVGMDGSPLPRHAMKQAEWAFDAVYTPVETLFLKDATAMGLAIISGYELFFGQGVDAWRLFTGLPLDTARLRAELAQEV